MKKNILTIILIAIVASVFFNLSDVICIIIDKKINSENNSFLNIFQSLLFNVTIKKSQNDIINCMFGTALPIVFNFISGSLLYKDLCISSTYYFVRQPNKSIWYYKKIIYISALTYVYTLFSELVPFIVSLINSEEHLSFYHFKIWALFNTSIFFFTLILTLMINILSIFIGSAFSFVSIYSFTAICFCITVSLDDYKLLGKIPISKLNPVNNTVLQWQNSKVEKYISLLFNLIYIMFIIILGNIIIRNIDISWLDKEKNI